MMAILNENEAVCLDGRWRGWLFRRDPNVGWISVRKLPIEAPEWPEILKRMANPTEDGDGW